MSSARSPACGAKALTSSSATGPNNSTPTRSYVDAARSKMPAICAR